MLISHFKRDGSAFELRLVVPKNWGSEIELETANTVVVPHKI